MGNILAGRNPVLEAIAAERTIDRLYVKKGEADARLRRIISMAKELGAPVSEVPTERLFGLCGTAAHQGVVAIVSDFEFKTPEDMLAAAEAAGEPPLLIICDSITDPHNLGSIVRTANAAGAHGVIIPKHGSAPLDAAAAKSAAGALEHTPVARVTNIARTISELKEKGLWVAGADMGGEPLYSADLGGPLAIVIGGEGSGIRRLVKEKCDFLVGIPMMGRINSLNASTAAALVIYEAVRARRG